MKTKPLQARKWLLYIKLWRSYMERSLGGADGRLAYIIFLQIYMIPPPPDLSWRLPDLGGAHFYIG